MVLTLVSLAAPAGTVRPLLAGGPESLLEAVGVGNLDVVRTILARGASPDTRDELGRTALMLAADRGDRGVAEALLDDGAAMDARTPSGDTALMVAASRGRVDVVRLLLERSADVTAVSVDGWTAATLAQHNRHPAVVALLLGATPPEPSTAPRRSARVGAPSSALTIMSPSALSSVQTQPWPETVPPSVQLELVLAELSSPLYVTHSRDRSDRLFVVEQGGRILVLQPQASTATVFLDITSRVLSGGEQGLLGLAFHPDYATNRRFFVNYTRQPDGATVIAEYQASVANPNVAATGETVLLVVAQPFANHNGGMIEFGPDRFLYIGMGDGGSANDPGNRSQNVNELLGKLLRINVDTPNPPALYSSPPAIPSSARLPPAMKFSPWAFATPSGFRSIARPASWSWATSARERAKKSIWSRSPATMAGASSRARSAPASTRHRAARRASSVPSRNTTIRRGAAPSPADTCTEACAARFLWGATCTVTSAPGRSSDSLQ
jgi:hypothetical protein